MDLQEQVRRDDVYDRITKINDELNNLGVFPSLVWVWAWSNVLDKIDAYYPGSGEYSVINPKFSQKDIWDMFWDQADKNGFTLEYGPESLDDHIFDWMFANDILIAEEEDDDTRTETT